MKHNQKAFNKKAYQFILYVLYGIIKNNINIYYIK